MIQRSCASLDVAGGGTGCSMKCSIAGTSSPVVHPLLTDQLPRPHRIEGAHHDLVTPA